MNNNIDIFGCIYKGADYIVRLELGKTFDKYLEKNEEEYILLVPNSILLDFWSVEKFFERYYVHAIFELANAYLGNYNEPYMLWQVKKVMPEKVKTSVYFKYAHPYRDDEGKTGVLMIPEIYTDEYKAYVQYLQNWLDLGIKPDDIKNTCEFNCIDRYEFDTSKPYARFYRKANKEFRRMLMKADIVKLGDVAEISYSSALDGGNNTSKVKALKMDKIPNYPYIPENEVEDGFISSEKVYKGDIIRYQEGFFLVDKESDIDIYAPLGHQVIRAKGVCPEFLYLYLNSDTAKQVFYTLEFSMGDGVKGSLYGDLNSYPVIKPNEEEKLYKEKFEMISHPEKRYYSGLQVEFVPNAVEDILVEELINKVKKNGRKLIEHQIEEDVAELRICFKNKAYKATLILAGSIMEALLIDWLSEIRGVDFFSVDLMKRRWDKKQKCYAVDAKGNYIYSDKKADLADYIDEIRDIKKPSWMQEAMDAHTIREKRNLVHAKLCLKNSVKIDEKLCRNVMEYLNNIISSRWED